MTRAFQTQTKVVLRHKITHKLYIALLHLGPDSNGNLKHFITMREYSGKTGWLKLTSEEYQSLMIKMHVVFTKKLGVVHDE